MTSVTVMPEMLAAVTSSPCACRLRASSPSAAVPSSTLAMVSEKRAMVAIATCRSRGSCNEGLCVRPTLPYPNLLYSARPIRPF